MSEPTKFLLPEDAIPTHWVNLLPDLPGEPLPPLSPRTGEPAGPDDLTPIFPHGPDRARRSRRSRRSRSPTPCARPTSCGGRRRCTARAGSSRRSARRRGSSTSTRASPPPARTSRTPRSPQAYENAQAGIAQARDRDRRRAVGLRARVRLLAVRARVRGVHGRLELRPEALPALDDGDVGRDACTARRRTARRRAARRPSTRPARSGSRSPRRSRSRRGDPDCNYALGSVLNHVLLHQTVIGQEAIAQLELAGAGMPDVIVGCVGGGSNFGGLVFPFLRAGSGLPDRRRRAGRLPDAHARRLLLRLRRHGRDDAADADVHARPRLRPAAGARRRPALPRRRADGLRARPRRPGRGARLPARTRRSRRRCAFARSEGIIPAPEPAHAIRAVIEEASRRRGEDDPVRPLRPRPLRPRRLRRVPRRAARGPGVLRGRPRGGAGRAAGGARDRLTAEGAALGRRSALYSYASATSTFVRAARRAGSTAASTPATTATTANADQRAGRDGERQALVGERRRHGGRERRGPSAMPVTAPISAVMTLSWRTIRRTWRRDMPTARSVPSSRVRSNVASTSVLTMPNSDTITASASST